VEPAVAWLLGSEEPAIRHQARRDLLGKEDPGDRAAILDGPIVQALMAGQQKDGGFGVHPYHKWMGAHWRLVSLVELEATPGEPRLMAALDTVLDWIADPRLQGTSRRRSDGVILSHASMEGNALAVACRLGQADDPRAYRLAERLIEWQWPDGGWNCNARASGRRSSFHETHSAMWGLSEYGTATGSRAAGSAANRAAELFLEHRLFRRHGSEGPIHPQWIKPRYPPYWHYDILQALHLLRRMGKVTDARASDALDVLVERRDPDGTWAASGYWWRSPDAGGASVEVVDWGRGGPNPMLTLNALRVLKAAGRWPGPGS
jgi:hypothetical protein